MPKQALLQAEHVGETVIITPTRDLGEFEVAEIDRPMYEQLVELAADSDVVMDLSHTDYFGSSTIGIFNRLVKHVLDSDHRIAFCNLSSHEYEVIEITCVNKLWKVFESREAAIDFVSQRSTEEPETN